MKINKITALAALAVATLVTFNLNAAEQPKGEGKERPAAGRPGRVGEELGLTPEQKSKFEAIQKDAAEKRKALREDTSLTQEQRREKAKAINEETKVKLKEILTAEQLSKMEERQKNRPGRPGGPGQPKPGDAPAKK